MKDWRTPEVKDLAISATEFKGNHGANHDGVGSCPTPIFSGGVCEGDISCGKDHGKDHWHDRRH